MVRMGTYEAKTHWSELLQRVAAGETFAITRHGKVLAVLKPAREETRKLSVAEAIAGLRKASKGLSLGGLKVRDLINEGRR